METTLQGERPLYGRGLTGVGDGVWAWLQPNGSWGEANAGLVVGAFGFVPDEYGRSPALPAPDLRGPAGRSGRAHVVGR